MNSLFFDCPGKRPDQLRACLRFEKLQPEDCDSPSSRLVTIEIT
jgi:hypothetical protein